jgi:predicted DNA-binding transcriptional regulator AlpA
MEHRHHLDRRAAEIAEKGREGDPAELFTTLEVAAWLGVSRQWLEIGRSKNYGPAYVRVGPRHIRYKRSDVILFLDERTHRCTAEYG